MGSLDHMWNYYALSPEAATEVNDYTTVGGSYVGYVKLREGRWFNGRRKSTQHELTTGETLTLISAVRHTVSIFD